MDIATLGIQIDSRPTLAAVSALNRLVPAARAAEGAAVRNANAFSRVGQVASMLPPQFGAVSAGLAAFSLGATAGGIAVAGLAYAVGSKAVTAFQELELEQARYNAVLQATSFAAGKTADDIEGLATSIRNSSTATEGAVREAAALLLTFRNVSGAAFDETLKLSQDLAAVGFGSITSAATMMGKALEDPIVGMTALRRIGVSFNAAQKEQIKNFLETGQAGRAQQVILEGVRKQVGGTGAAQGATLTGAWNQLGEATNNWLERTGETITNALGIGSAIRGIAAAIDSVNTKAEAASSPQGVLDSLRADRDTIANRRGGNARQKAAALAFTDEKIRAAELAVELDRVAKAYSEGQATSAAFVAQIERNKSAFDGVTFSLHKQNKELRMTALQRETDAAVKKAQAEAGATFDSAQKKQIETMVKENFYLREGTALAQMKIGTLGDGAAEGENRNRDSHQPRLAATQSRHPGALRRRVLFGRRRAAGHRHEGSHRAALAGAGHGPRRLDSASGADGAFAA